MINNTIEKCDKHDELIKKTSRINVLEEKVEAGFSHINKSIDKLYNSIEKIFDIIGEHIKEGPIWRERIKALEVKFEIENEKQIKDRKNKLWLVKLGLGIPAIILSVMKILDWMIEIMQKIPKS